MEKIIRDISNKKLKELKVADNFKQRNIAKYKDGNVVLIGMRRLGKTEYLKYRAKLSSLSNEEMLFINFDNSLLKVINFKSTDKKYEEFLKAFYNLLSLGTIKLVLLDEIQIVKDWSSLLKSWIDDFPDISFVATGSDALELLNSTDSGVGRFSLKYVGPLTYMEYKKMYDGSFSDYINDYSYPQGSSFSLEQRYEAIIEKQIRLLNFQDVNIENVIRTIALNPGIKLTRNKVSSLIKQESDSKADPKQVDKILEFLIKSQIIFSIPDKYLSNKSSKQTTLTLYPYDWNMYSYFSIVNKYEDHPNKIDQDQIYKVLPTKGFIFENMIISNIYTYLDTNLDRNFLFNKIEEPDLDFILKEQGYEIKNVDCNELDETSLIKIINKAKETNAIIIHLGKTKEVSNVIFKNWEEFLGELGK